MHGGEETGGTEGAAGDGPGYGPAPDGNLPTWPPAGWQPPAASPYLADDLPTTAPQARKHRRALVGASLAAVVIGVAAAVAVSTSSPSHHLATVDGLVAASAQHTLAEKSAEVELSGSVTAPGLTMPLRGSGTIDFTTDSMSLDIGASTAGHSIRVKEIAAGRMVYMAMTVDGHGMSQLTGGYDWVELPIVTSGSTDVGGNPAAALKTLEEQGAQVTPLGTKQIDGTLCRGYEVIPDRQAMIAGAQKEFDAMGLSPTEASEALQRIQQASPPRIDVWFDGHQLTRQMGMDMQIGGLVSSAPAGSGATQMTLTFTRYGTPARITVPSPSNAMTYENFLSYVRQHSQS